MQEVKACDHKGLEDSGNLHLGMRLTSDGFTGDVQTRILQGMISK